MLSPSDECDRSGPRTVGLRRRASAGGARRGSHSGYATPTVPSTQAIFFSPGASAGAVPEWPVRESAGAVPLTLPEGVLCKSVVPRRRRHVEFHRPGFGSFGFAATECTCRTRGILSLGKIVTAPEYVPVAPVINNPVVRIATVPPVFFRQLVSPIPCCIGLRAFAKISNEYACAVQRLPGLRQGTDRRTSSVRPDRGRHRRATASHRSLQTCTVRPAPSSTIGTPRGERPGRSRRRPRGDVETPRRAVRGCSRCVRKKPGTSPGIRLSRIREAAWGHLSVFPVRRQGSGAATLVPADAFLDRHANRPEAAELVEMERRESDLYRRYQDWFSYGFYVARKR